jgi:uncharacterized protein
MPVANLSHPLVPVCDVLINGKSWTAEEKAHVASVTVDERLDAAGMLTFELFEPGGHNPKPSWLDDIERFAISSEIEIKMGYAGDLETLAVGEITGLDPSFARDRLPRLTVRGYDRRHRLQRGRKTRPFVQQKDSDIAAQIAEEAKLTAETTDSQVTHDYVLQDNKTDWDFLSERARSIKYEVRVEGKKLIFRPVANAESEALTLSLAEDLLNFQVRLSSVGQVTEVAVRGWDPKEKKAVVGQARTGDEDSTMGGQQSGSALAESAFGSAVEPVGSRPVMSQAEADQMARALLNQRLLELVTGSGSCLGRTDLRSGKVIRIEGVGKSFSGQYYVTGATHSYSPQGGYRTNFSVRRNAV